MLILGKSEDGWRNSTRSIFHGHIASVLKGQMSLQSISAFSLCFSFQFAQHCFWIDFPRSCWSSLNLDQDGLLCCPLKRFAVAHLWNQTCHIIPFNLLLLPHYLIWKCIQFKVQHSSPGLFAGQIRVSGFSMCKRSSSAQDPIGPILWLFCICFLPNPELVGFKSCPSG